MLNIISWVTTKEKTKNCTEKEIRKSNNKIQKNSIKHRNYSNGMIKEHKIIRLRENKWENGRSKYFLLSSYFKM